MNIRKIMMSAVAMAVFCVCAFGQTTTTQPAATVEHPLKKAANAQVESEIALKEAKESMKHSDGEVTNDKLNRLVSTMFQTLEKTIDRENNVDEATRNKMFIESLEKEISDLRAEWEPDEQTANKIFHEMAEQRENAEGLNGIFASTSEILEQLKRRDLNVEIVIPLYTLVIEQSKKIVTEHKKSKEDFKTLVQKWQVKADSVKSRYDK